MISLFLLLSCAEKQPVSDRLLLAYMGNMDGEIEPCG